MKLVILGDTHIGRVPRFKPLRKFYFWRQRRKALKLLKVGTFIPMGDYIQK